jgi:hypothetical protein
MSSPRLKEKSNNKKNVHFQLSEKRLLDDPELMKKAIENIECVDLVDSTDVETQSLDVDDKEDQVEESNKKTSEKTTRKVKTRATTKESADNVNGNKLEELNLDIEKELNSQHDRPPRRFANDLMLKEYYAIFQMKIFKKAQYGKTLLLTLLDENTNQYFTYFLPSRYVRKWRIFEKYIYDPLHQLNFSLQSFSNYMKNGSANNYRDYKFQVSNRRIKMAEKSADSDEESEGESDEETEDESESESESEEEEPKKKRKRNNKKKNRRH